MYTIVDLRVFNVLETREVAGIFSAEPKRGVQEVLLQRKENAELIRLVNVHLPGDPTKPNAEDFAKYLAKTFDKKITTIAVGDMNADEMDMYRALESAFEERSPFALHSPYRTDISPYVLESKAIDHFLVYSAESKEPVLAAPEELMPGLNTLVDLLREPLESVIEI